MSPATTVALICIATRAFAQESATLAARLDRPTYVAVSAIVDSARLAKLPTKPLLDKAFEGAAKGSMPCIRPHPG